MTMSFVLNMGRARNRYTTYLCCAGGKVHHTRGQLTAKIIQLLKEIILYFLWNNATL